MWNSNIGTWNTSHILRDKRDAHTSWTPESGSGTYLIGGSASPSTTEIVKEGEDVSSSLEFYLKYEERLIVEKYFAISHISNSQPKKTCRLKDKSPINGGEF